MADYTPGKMNIKDQSETYDLFWGWSVRVSVIVAVILILLITFFT